MSTITNFEAFTPTSGTPVSAPAAIAFVVDGGNAMQSQGKSATARIRSVSIAFAQ